MQSDKEISRPTLTRTQQSRRQDIIAAAVRVINRSSYAAASVQKIAEEARTSKSTVLYHFKSKAAIERAVIGSIFEEGAAFMTPFILRANNYREKLAAYLTSNLQFIAGHVADIAALHEISRNISPASFENSSSFMQDEAPIVWLRNMLTEGQRMGEFGVFDPLVMSAGIRLVIDGSSRYILTHPLLDVAHYTAEIVRLFDVATAAVNNQKGG